MNAYTTNHEIEVCSACGARISPLSDRAYAFSRDGLLCWSCAVRRGGAYDALHERWIRPPDIDDLVGDYDDQ